MNEERFVELMKFKAYLIFDKYINYGSRYEIDINPQIQMSVCEDMDNKLDWMDRDEMDCNALIRVFNTIIDDIVSRMKKSYIRFVREDSNKIKICTCCY